MITNNLGKIPDSIFLVVFTRNKYRSEETYQSVERIWFYTEDDARKFGEMQVKRLSYKHPFSIIRYSPEEEKKANKL